MKNLTISKIIPLPLVTLLFAFAICGQSQPTPNSSADSSPISDIPDSGRVLQCRELIASCSAAAAELAAQRDLNAALEAENKALRERLATERGTSELLTELAETRRRENEALRSLAAAKDDVIAAQNRVIDGQKELVAALKRQRTPLWQRVAVIAAGAVAIALIK